MKKKSDFSARLKLKDFKPLRARLSQQMCDWFNEAGILSRADTRARAKKIYLHVVRHRLKNDVEGCRAVVSRGHLRQILYDHRDCKTARGGEAKRKWAERSIKLLEKLPCVTRHATFITLDRLNADHGTDEEIDAHHSEAAHRHKVNQAAYAQRQRTHLSGLSAASAKFCVSRPKRAIVESEPPFRFTKKQCDLYNALPPPMTTATPILQTRFALTGPKPSASANRLAHQPQSKSSNLLASFLPQRGKPFASISYKSAPYRKDWSNRHFDPKTNNKGRRLFGTVPINAAFVQLKKAADPTLANLRFERLRAQGALVETFSAACNLYLRRPPEFYRSPADWICWAERALRQGRLRYAGDIY